jgi:tol-pal system protein YbgF
VLRSLTSACFLLAAFAAQAAAPVKEIDTTGLAARVERIERMLESRGLVDMLAQLEALQAEVNRLRGEIELQSYAIEELRKRERDLYSDLDTRLRRLESGLPPAQAGAPPSPADEASLQTLSTVEDVDEEVSASAIADAEPGLTVELVGPPPAPASAPPAATPDATVAAAAPEIPAAAPAGTAAPPGTDPIKARADYQQAFNLLKQSLYAQSIKAFQEFLVAHPGSEYADDAQYWLGEAHYVNRDFEPALGEYRKLVSGYPDSPKLTQALLKVGYTLQELGRIDEARAALQDLVKRYPGTSAARLAEERLATLPSAAAAGTTPQ